jgi:hypothetical protein
MIPSKYRVGRRYLLWGKLIASFKKMNAPTRASILKTLSSDTLPTINIYPGLMGQMHLIAIQEATQHQSPAI